MIKDFERSKLYHYEVLTSNDPRQIFAQWIKVENAKILDVGCACGDFINSL